MYSDDFYDDPDIDTPLLQQNSLLPQTGDCTIDIESIPFNDIGDYAFGECLISSEDGLARILDETLIKIQCNNTDLRLEGITGMIHICKYAIDAQDDSIKDSDLNIFINYFCDTMENLISNTQYNSLIQVSQNLIQSTVTALMRYAFDDRVLDRSGCMKTLMHIYTFCKRYNEDTKCLGENVIFCYKKGYMPKLLDCIKICSESMNVLDTIKSLVQLRTTPPMFTDEEKLILFGLIKKGVQKLQPDLNFGFLIELTKNLYQFMPKKISGISSYEVIDKMVIETMMGYWMSESESDNEKKALDLVVNNFSSERNKVFKWMTPLRIREMVQEYPQKDKLSENLSRYWKSIYALLQIDALPMDILTHLISIITNKVPENYEYAQTLFKEIIASNKLSKETLKYIVSSLCSPSNINRKLDAYCLKLIESIINNDISVKDTYISFLMDIVDSKSKITYKTYMHAKERLVRIFHKTFSTDATIECVIQQLKRSSYNSFGAITALRSILCNPNNYFSAGMLDLSKQNDAKPVKKGTEIYDVLVEKYDLLNELCAAGRVLCEKALKNEFNGDDLAGFYENLFYSIYGMSVLGNSFDLVHFQQILEQFDIFKDDSNLLELTIGFLNRIIKDELSKYIEKKKNIIDIRHIEKVYSLRDALRGMKDGSILIVYCFLWINIVNGYISCPLAKEFLLMKYPLLEQDYIFNTLFTATDKATVNKLCIVIIDIGTKLIMNNERCQEIGENVRNGIIEACVKRLKQSAADKCSDPTIARNALKLAHMLYEMKDRILYKFWDFKSVNTLNILVRMFPEIPETAGIFPSAVSIFDTLEEAKAFIQDNIESIEDFDEMETYPLSTEESIGYIKSFHELLSDNKDFVAALSDLCTMFRDENLEKLVATILRPRDEALIVAETKNPEHSREFWEKTLILASFSAQHPLSPQEDSFIDRALRILNDVFTREADSDKDFIESFIKYGGINHFVKYMCFNIEMNSQEKAVLCLEIFKVICACRHCSEFIDAVPLDEVVRSILNTYPKMSTKLCKAAYALMNQIKSHENSHECREFVATKIREFYEMLASAQLSQICWQNYVDIITALCWDKRTADDILDKILRAIGENPHSERNIPLVTLANNVMEACEDASVQPQILYRAQEILNTENDKVLFVEYLRYFNNAVKHGNDSWNMREIFGVENIVKFVFWRCLFSISEEEEGKGSPRNNGEVPERKCTSEVSTRLALDLLYNISRRDETYVAYIFNEVVVHYNHFKDYISRVDKKFDFSSLGRNENHRYCGLNNKNLKVCFGNVIIQALYMIPQFRMFVLNSKPIIDEKKLSNDKTTFIELKKLFYQMMYSNLKFCEPYELCKCVWGMEIENQEDACEFLVKIISSLEGAFQDNDDLKFAIPKMFTGKTVQTITCNKGHKKVINENFLTLNLNVNHERLEDALDEYMKGERITEYKCEECKSNTQSAIALGELKDIFIIQLMRFSFSDTEARKLFNCVHFPRILDMGKYVNNNRTEGEAPLDKCENENDEGNLYDLVGIVMHSGIVGTGHYYCFLKNTTPIAGDTTTTGSTEWLRFDDKNVRPWDIDANFEKDCFGDGTEDSATPYILIYSRHIKRYEELEAKRCRFDTDSPILSFSRAMPMTSSAKSAESGITVVSSTTPEVPVPEPAQSREKQIELNPSEIIKGIEAENKERDKMSSAFNMNYINFVRRMYENVDKSKSSKDQMYLLVPIYYMTLFSEIVNSTEFNSSWLNIIDNITKNNINMIECGLKNANFLLYKVSDTLTTKKIAGILISWINSCDLLNNNISEAIYPLTDVLLSILKYDVYKNLGELIQYMMTLLIDNKERAPKELLTKYLTIITESLKKVPEDQRTPVLRRGRNKEDIMDMINVISDVNLDEEASCLLINTLISGSELLIQEAAYLIVCMLSDESKTALGSLLIREILKRKDDFFEYRCVCAVWDLEIHLKSIMNSNQVYFCTQALSSFSLLIEICSEIPMCCGKLMDFEPRQRMCKTVADYIEYINCCNVGDYIINSFKTLYSKLESLLCSIKSVHNNNININNIHDYYDDDDDDDDDDF